MMHLANELARSLADLFWRASWQGGIFIVLVWLACRLLPQLPAQGRRWLWWLACLQMGLRLIPVSYLALPVLPARPAPAAYEVDTLRKPDVRFDFNASKTNAPEPATPLQPEDSEKPAGMLLIAFAWLVGCLALFEIFLSRWRGLKKLIRESSSATEDEVLAVVRHLSAELKLRAPTVVESAAAPCPMVAGWIHPVLILPNWAVDKLDKTELKLAICHELLHIKHRDLWVGLLPAIVKGIFFFHPLAWLASHEAGLACEEACDEETLRLSKGSAAVYARLLLASAQSGTTVAALGAAFGYKSLQRRITMLQRFVPTTSPRRVRASTILIAFAAICALPWTVTAQAPSHVAASSHSKTGLTVQQTTPGMPVPIGMIMAGPMICELKTVQKELKLTDDQVRKIKPLESDDHTPQRMSRAEIDGKMKGILNDRQFTRYEQLVLQAEGPMTFYRPDVQKKLGLTDEQIFMIKSIDDEDAKTVHPMPADGDMRAAIRAHEKQLMGKLADVLTDAQRATWKTMIGAKFDFPELPVTSRSAPQALAAPAKGRAGTSSHSHIAITVKQPATKALETKVPKATAPPKKAVSAPTHAVPTTAAPTQPDLAKSADGKMSVKFKNAPLREALVQVFERAGVDYTIEPDVPDALITCSVKSGDLGSVLRAIIVSAPKTVGYQIDGKLYIVKSSDHSGGARVPLTGPNQ